MSVDKFQILLKALREAAIIVIAAIEDYLGLEADRSALAKRRAKVKET